MNRRKVREPIRLRERPLKSGNIALYLDKYANGKRKFENLKLYLIPEKTREDVQRNERTLQLAEAVKAKRIIEFQNNRFGFSNVGINREADFFVYYDKHASIGKGNTVTHNVRAKLQAFVGKDKLPFKLIDEDFVLKFIKFLHKCEYKEKQLSKNTIRKYFFHFTHILKMAVRDNILGYNPADKIDPKLKPKGETGHREYLTEEELLKLSKTKTKYRHTSTIFMFSCLTGLRYSDVTSLRWKDLVPTKDGGYRLSIIQEKTDVHLEFTIPPSATALLPKRSNKSNPNTKIFGKKYTVTSVENHLRRWVADAGINKHISFHCSRHTFATLMLAKGASLYTVSKLLGHTSINTTQIYAKVVEEAKMKALDLLPSLNVDHEK